MCDMTENKQIEKASLLADVKPAEELDSERARSFIGTAMNSGRQAERGHRPLFYCASAVLAVAAIAAVAVISRPEVDGSGTPAVLSEESYVHASAAAADSAFYMQADSLAGKSEVQE